MESWYLVYIQIYSSIQLKYHKGCHNMFYLSHKKSSIRNSSQWYMGINELIFLFMYVKIIYFLVLYVPLKRFVLLKYGNICSGTLVQIVVYLFQSSNKCMHFFIFNTIIDEIWNVSQCVLIDVEFWFWKKNVKNDLKWHINE